MDSFVPVSTDSGTLLDRTDRSFLLILVWFRGWRWFRLLMHQPIDDVVDAEANGEAVVLEGLVPIVQRTRGCWKAMLPPFYQALY